MSIGILESVCQFPRTHTKMSAGILIEITLGLCISLGRRNLRQWNPQLPLPSLPINLMPGVDKGIERESLRSNQRVRCLWPVIPLSHSLSFFFALHPLIFPFSFFFLYFHEDITDKLPDFLFHC